MSVLLEIRNARDKLHSRGDFQKDATLGGRLAPLARLARPGQWVKNLFVLSGILFSLRWSEGETLVRAFLATLAFCMISSAVYCLNDLMDMEKDRQHPLKRNRPLASGLLHPRTAVIASLLLALAGSAAAWTAGPWVAAIVAAYLGLNLSYSAHLKHKVIIDVFCISLGFMLRILAGTIGIGIEPSQWLILCTMLLSLFLGFSKRYAELAAPHNDLTQKRKVLRSYSLDFLHILLGITLCATMMAYGLYTVNPRTVEVHGTENLIYTLPIVIFGLFRYLYLVIQCRYGENTASEMIKDKQLVLTAAAYVASVASIIYFRP